MSAALPTAATDSLLSTNGLLDLLGGAAGLLAMLGLALLLPLYVSHRREVARLLDWREREPEAGTTEFRAIADPAAAGSRPLGRLSPAERVTSERPALARIRTGEYAAVAAEDLPFWRRVVDRGPRHPLVLTLLAILVAAAIVVAAGLLIRASSDDGRQRAGVDPGSVDVVVVNAGDSPGIAADIADGLAAKGFRVTGTPVASMPVRRSVVRYADGAKPEGQAVKRVLGLSATRFDPAAEAAANGADVVVVAGKDAQLTGGKG